MSQVTIYIDGRCQPNPGPGGYATLLTCGQHEKQLVGGEKQTTSNRMILNAALAGLNALKRPAAVTIVTDNPYLARILAGGDSRANLDLVEKVQQKAEAHTLTIRKVQNYRGDPHNERVHQVAEDYATRIANGL